MNPPEIVVKQTTTSSFWKWLAIAIALCFVAATLLRKCETDKVEKSLIRRADSTEKIAYAERVGRLTAQAANETRSKEQAERNEQFTAALSRTQADVNKIAQWAESLDIKRQIGEIAKKLPKPLQGDSARIQSSYTPADIAIIKELYKRIEEGQLYARKYDTAARQAVNYHAQVDTLRSQQLDYRVGYVAVQQALLNEAERARFLGIGRRVAMRRLAKAVGQVASDPGAESELERELNGRK